MSSFQGGPGEFNTVNRNPPQVTVKGLSTDTKPSATVFAGYYFYETDTTNTYLAYNGVWNLIPKTSASSGGGGSGIGSKFTANGGGTSFTIPHGLGVVPAFVEVGAGSTDARGTFSWTADANNITVTYPIATPSGTSNIVLWWTAGTQTTASSVTGGNTVAGTSTQSGDASTKIFTITHGLPSLPSGIMVEADSIDALGDFTWTFDATNITITYQAAPPTGTSNLTWKWIASFNVSVSGFTATSTDVLNNKTIDSGLNTVKEAMGFDAYVYIDANDGNKIKGRMNGTGVIYSHATNADVVIQSVINDLSTLSLASGWYWTGGKYGSIFFGPGLYTFFNGVIYKSQIIFQGCGLHTTIFKWADNNLLGNHNQTMFRSSAWDANHIATTPSTSGDAFVIFRDLDIDGNWINNVIPPTNTATTTLDGSGYETAALDSWGHGIAHYGYGLRVENVAVHGCPGAGIITQFNNFAGVNTEGSIYPIGTGTRWYTSLNYIRNVECWGNGRQGLLIRSFTYVDNYWSYFNGEAGIDVQACANFPGGCWISNIEIFLDGLNHGNQTSTVYDPLGFEMRTNGGWMNNCWIEAPYGPGDNICFGSPPTTSAPSPTGYQLRSSCSKAEVQGLQLDNARWAEIYLTPGAFDNTIQARCEGNSKTGTQMTPARIEGYGNKLDLTVEGFNFAGCTGVLLGHAGVFSSNGNDIRISAGTTSYILNCVQAGNAYNTIDIKIRGYPSPTNLLAIFDPTQTATLDFTINTVNVDAPNLGAGFKGHNGGIATFSGDGSTKAFVIPHLLFTSPTVVSVSPNTDDARGPATITFDSTNITATYGIAPLTGTNNVKLLWNARVSP